MKPIWSVRVDQRLCLLGALIIARAPGVLRLFEDGRTLRRLRRWQPEQ